VAHPDVHLGESSILRWAGSIGYNLKAPLVLVAKEGASLLLTPDVISNVPSRSRESGTLPFVASVEPPRFEFGAEPLVLRHPRPTDDLVAQLRVRPSEVAEAALRRDQFKERGFRVRLPVDEALMLHLIRVRTTILNREPDAGVLTEGYLDLDTQLLELTGTLIFLRIVEDRYGSIPRGSLWNIAAHQEDQAVVNGIAALSTRAATKFGQHALPFTAWRWRSIDAVRGLIRGLYWNDKQLSALDFRLLDEDILAQLYQEYLQYLLTQREATSQIRLFGDEHRITKRVRRDLGIYYTPRSLVDIVIAEIDRHVPTGTSLPYVLEPACGAGAFLRPAMNWLLQRWPHKTSEEVARHAFGVDFDPRAVTLARQALSRNFVDRDKEVPVFQLRVADFLSEDILTPPSDGEAQGFDIVVGNPPFLAHQKLKQRDPQLAELYRSRFADAVGGETNLAAYFLVQSLRALRPGGILGFVVPRRFLRGSNQAIRTTIFQHAEVLAVVDFGNVRVFHDAGETTALLFLRKRNAPVEQPSPTETPGIWTLTFRDDLAPLVIRALRGEGRSTELHRTVLRGHCKISSEGPWIILSDAGKQAHELLTKHPVKVTELVKRMYAVDDPSGNALLFNDPRELGNHLLDVRPLRPGRGRVQVEEALLRAAVVTEDVQRFRELPERTGTYIFHPFDPTTGRAYAEEYLFAETSAFPQWRELLTDLRPILENIRAERKVPEWYAPAGSRVQAVWHSPDVKKKFGEQMLIAPRWGLLPNFAVAPTSLIPVGALFAYPIYREAQRYFNHILMFLNSSLADWFVIMRTPNLNLTGEPDRSRVTFDALTVPQHYLETSVDEVQESLTCLSDPSAQLSAAEILRHENRIDQWVYNAFGFDSYLRDQIRSEVAAFTGKALVRSADARAAKYPVSDAELRSLFFRTVA
jgi:SAM-dependent methyltransferase